MPPARLSMRKTGDAFGQRGLPPKRQIASGHRARACLIARKASVQRVGGTVAVPVPAVDVLSGFNLIQPHFRHPIPAHDGIASTRSLRPSMRSGDQSAGRIAYRPPDGQSANRVALLSPLSLGKRMEIFGLIGIGTIVAAGLAGYYGWSWATLLIILLVAVSWHAFNMRHQIAAERGVEGNAALLRHFGTLPIPLGIAWVIGYALAALLR